MVSHEYKFIFIHIGRTAGCSIERTLCNNYCGNESQLTMNKWVLYTGSEEFVKKHPKTQAGHWIPKEIKSFFGEKIYNEYFKFTVVRNPWQRMLSQFKKTQDKKNGMSFKGWIHKSFVLNDRNMDERFYKPCKWWIDGGVDYIIKYENLDEDFSKLLDKGASLIFDPVAEKAAAEATRKESLKAIKKLENDKAGLQLSINNIDKQAATEAASKRNMKV